LGVAGWLAGCAVFATGLTTSTLHAEDPVVAKCTTSYEKAQILRKKEDFLGSREELLLCGAPNCPALIQNDCVVWLPTLEDSIPLVVFEAKVNGESVFDVTVIEGDKTLLTHLDGKPVEVNPGPHLFTFLRAGSATLQEKAIVRRGEKSRMVVASWTVSTSVPVSVREIPGAATGSAAAEAKSRPIPPLFYVLTGAGVLGLGTFAVLGLSTQSDQNNLASTCAPLCSDASVNSLRALFTRPERTERLAIADSRLGLIPTTGGLRMNWTGSF
jgi:hypothetical protein